MAKWKEYKTDHAAGAVTVDLSRVVAVSVRVRYGAGTPLDQDCGEITLYFDGGGQRNIKARYESVMEDVKGVSAENAAEAEMNRVRAFVAGLVQEANDVQGAEEPMSEAESIRRQCKNAVELSEAALPPNYIHRNIVDGMVQKAVFAEREECAKIVDRMKRDMSIPYKDACAYADFASQIRNRSATK